MVSSFVDIMTGQYVRLRYERAEVFARVVAQCIDVLIPLLLLDFAVSLVDKPSSLFFFFFIICFYSINLFLEYNLRGKTIGKMVMNLRVVSIGCNPPSFHQCFLRWVLFPVDCLLVGFILMTKSTGRLGDLASGCQVVSDKQVRTINLDEDFRCYDDNYSPMFQSAKSFSPNVMNAITKVLYDRLQSVYLDEVAALVRQKIQPSEASKANALSDVSFLKQVLQDVKFFADQRNNS